MAMALPPLPPPPAAALPPPPPAPSGLTVKRRAPEEAHAATTAGAPAGEAPAMSGGLKVKGVAPSAHTPAASAASAPAQTMEASTSESKSEEPYQRKAYVPQEAPAGSLPRGLAGAAIGATVGALIWYAIFHFAEFEHGLFAFIPAALAGFLGRVMAKEENNWVGIAAAVFTLVAILGTRYVIYSKVVDDTISSIESLIPSYDERMAEAQEAVKAKTDDEIRNHLQNQARLGFEKYAEKGEKYEPRGIRKEEVDAFKKYALQAHQDFVNGKPSREEYEGDIAKTREMSRDVTRKGTVVAVLLRTGVFGIITLFFALSMAYRTGAG